ncbi:hypothetical protein TWF281_003491 [Arthrobotrys megalospora]
MTMKSTRIAVCGYGLRGRLFHNVYIAEQLSVLWRGLPIDRTPRTQDYFDMQSLTEGPGTAYQFGSDGALNTAPDPQVPSINKEGLTDGQCRIIDRLTDLAAHYAELAMADPEETMAKLLKNNVATAMLFNSASKTGKLDTSVTCGPRHFSGDALEVMTKEAFNLAREYLPWLSINVRHGVTVSDIDVSDPAHPSLTILNVETGETQTGLVYDLVVKCTGTTFDIPVSGEIKDNAFTGVPNANLVTGYLEQQKMLDSEGKIIPGKRLLIGGTGLSAFDFIGLIATRTKLVTFNPETKVFKIDEEEAQRHQNLITLFSRTDGMFGAPRHLPESVANLGSDLIDSEMIVSLGLQKNADTYPTFLELARILTASACRKRRRPSQIGKSVSTIEQMDHMAAENEVLARNPDAMTEAALFRKWIWCFVFTQTMGPEQGQQRAALEKKHNHLTRTGDGWRNFRTLSYDISHRLEGEVGDEKHKRHCHARRIAWNYKAACPAEVHTLITRLYKLGVVSWIQGAYEDIVWASETNKFELKGRKVDGLIAPRRMSPKSDRLSDRILEQAKSPAIGEPLFEKGRFLKNAAGEYIHVMELGFAGHGSQWFDTTAAGGAYQLMPVAANTSIILEALISKGVEKPVNELLELYNATIPSDRESEFNEQIKLMEEPHRNVTHMILYARLVEKVFGKRFAEKMRQGKTMAAREQVMSLIADIRRPEAQEALAEFEREWANYKFDPIDAQEFEKMTPEFSIEDTQAMRKLLAGMASRKSSDSYILMKPAVQVDVSEVAEIELDTFETPRSNTAVDLAGYDLRSVVGFQRDVAKRGLSLVSYYGPTH